MRIIFDYTAFVMQSNGGVSRVLFEAFQHLLKLDDVECCLFAGFHKNQYLRDASLEVKQQIVGWYCSPKIIKQRLFIPINRFLFQIFVKIYKPDICHYTYFDTPKVIDNCKVVVTIHDMIHEIYPSMFSYNDPQCVWKRKAVKKADGIVCVSNNTLNDLKKYIDLNNKQTCVIYHGNSFARIKPLPLNLKGSYFLYVGSRSTIYKNFDFVLEAFAEAKIEKELSLVCFGGGEFDSRELQIISKLGLSGRISQVSGSDNLLAAYYKNSKALIYPSLYEGFGLPPLEAMGLGCVVIASAAPPMPEIIEAAGLYFDPKNKKELIDCIKTVTEDDQQNYLIEKGLKQSRKFNWSLTAEKLVSFYEHLLNQSNSMSR